MSRRKKPIIAICYDFDGTLIRGNMQENSFLLDIRQTKKQFWTDVKHHAKQHDMDEILAYMHLMLKKADKEEQPFNKKSLREHGEDLKFFEGVQRWFDNISNHSNEISIEHYIISSGIDEMIKGSEIGKKFTHIFASGFLYDANDVAIFPARSINYTTKIQYLFRINKGIHNSWDNSGINKSTAEADRPVPFSQMIYIGDGETDVPAMKMLNYKGGYSIAVWPPEEGKRITKKGKGLKTKVTQLQKEGRCQFIAKADYREGQELYSIVISIIDRIINEKKYKMNLQAK